jgi:hypothetical protein
MYLHFPTTLAVIGALAVGGATVARAQDTSSAARSDTMGYQPSRGQTDTAQSQTGQTADTSMQRSDTSNYQSNGVSSDTALRAKPGVQTGPSANDSGKAMRHRMGAAGRPDTVVCKDGSNAGRRVGCGSHGGIDWAATRAAMKARGHEMGGHAGDSTGMRSDSTQGMSDTTQVNKQGQNYQYHGAPSDTALRAKPGTQTGESADSGAAKADSGTSR